MTDIDRMPMLSMQLRSLRVRALAGSFLIIFENEDPGTSVSLFLFRIYETFKKSTGLPAT